MTCEPGSQLVQLCAAWGRGPLVAAAPLATGGFSGVALHVVVLADAPGRFVLKSFAPHVARERAAWVHGLMRHARAGGVSEVPDVLMSAAGASLVADEDGRCWELVRFVEGRPFESPPPAHAAAALEAVGRLHAALESLPSAAPTRGPSPGVERRIHQARDLVDRPWSARHGAAHHQPETSAFVAAARLACREAGGILAAPLGRRGLEAVAAARIGVLRQQAVVRDIWSDHVLFDPTAAARVAGLVDFHAAGIDTPLTDIARLLGSWQPPCDGALASAAGPTAVWADALAAYERGRGVALTPADRRLCDWLHAAAVICSLDNWFRWVLTENRRFSDENRALQRIRGLLAELPRAVEWLADPGNQPV